MTDADAVLELIEIRRYPINDVGQRNLPAIVEAGRSRVLPFEIRVEYVECGMNSEVPILSANSVILVLKVLLCADEGADVVRL